MIYEDEHMWTGMNQWGDEGQNAVDVNSTQFVAPGCTALWAAGIFLVLFHSPTFFLFRWGLFLAV